MAMLRIFTLLTIAHLCFNIVNAVAVAKTYPGDPNWPSTAQWRALNTTLSGHLMAPTLPAQLACYGTTCNATSCDKAYRTHAFEEPLLVEYNWWTDFACPASNSSSKCDLSHYPAYVVRAESAKDVVTAVRFAAGHNIRLVVKNTGHDFLGKSVGAGALSIWTRNLRGVDFTTNWNGTGQAAVTIGAGVQFMELYRAAFREDRWIVGGTTSSVGAAGGWLQGGGHSMLSNLHGLGVDQVLSFEVVTPTGDLVTASDHENKDLFWALRGGGGGTFGVVTKVTLKTYPQTTLNCVKFDMIPMPDTVAGRPGFVKAAAWLMSQAPAMAEFGLTGYPILRPDSYSVTFAAPGKTWREIDAFWKPMMQKIQTFGVLAYDSKIESLSANNMFGSGVFPHSPLGGKKTGHAIQASRLLGARGLINVTSLEHLVSTLLAANYNLEPFIFGGAVQKNRNLDIGLNPAWRDSVMHLTILPRDTEDLSSIAEVKQAYAKMQREQVSFLDSLSVASGAYVNEGSFMEPEWQKTYWGPNYPRLLEIKRKYDPQNNLWCFPCVGSEVFTQGDDFKLYKQGV